MLEKLFENKIIYNIKDADLKETNLNLSDCSQMATDETKLVIVVSEIAAKILKDKEYQLLTNILGAIKLPIESVSIVNVCQLQNLHFVNIMKTCKVNKVMLFGTDFASLSLQFENKLFGTLKWKDYTIIQCPALNKLSENQAYKKSLWTVLKNEFTV